MGKTVKTVSHSSINNFHQKQLELVRSEELARQIIEQEFETFNSRCIASDIYVRCLVIVREIVTIARTSLSDNEKRENSRDPRTKERYENLRDLQMPQAKEKCFCSFC